MIKKEHAARRDRVLARYLSARCVDDVHTAVRGHECHSRLKAARLVHHRSRANGSSVRLDSVQTRIFRHRSTLHHLVTRAKMLAHNDLNFISSTSSRCRFLYLGPAGCFCRSRLTQRLTTPLCTSQNSLGCLSAVPESHSILAPS